MKGGNFTFGQVTPWIQENWDMRAAGNFIGGGTGSGLLIFVALSGAGGMLLQITTLLGLACVGLGLFLVWLEIGKPWRFLNVFRHPQTSWMSREAIVSVVLMPVGLCAVLTADGRIALAAGAIGLVFLYCQARILKASKGIPAWREPRIVPFILITGLTEGGGLFLALAMILAGSVPSWIEGAFLILVLARHYAFRAYFNRLASGKAPKWAVQVLKEAFKPFFLIGHLLATVFLALGMYFPSAQTPLFVLAGLTAMGAGWYIKAVIVTRAAFNQGYAIDFAPARGANPGPGAHPGWE